MSVHVSESAQSQDTNRTTNLWGVVSASGSCSTSHSTLTRQTTNQGIHYAFCSKPYLQTDGEVKDQVPYAEPTIDMNYLNV